MQNEKNTMYLLHILYFFLSEGSVLEITIFENDVDNVTGESLKAVDDLNSDYKLKMNFKIEEISKKTFFAFLFKEKGFLLKETPNT
jgi:hypothetical protein